MVDLRKAWAQELPDIRKGVTGVTIWNALNACQPVLIEGDTLVLGLKHEESTLAGHLRLPQTRTLIEKRMSERMGRPLTLRVIEGLTEQDWDVVKRKDEEAQRLQDRAHQKFRREAQSRTSWETVYEQLNKNYSALQNKSFPQSRSRFFNEAIAIVAEARREHMEDDELNERNYARCLERVAQYTELPSAFVALKIEELLGQP